MLTVREVLGDLEVRLMAGEGRARYLYTHDGATDEVLAAWERLETWSQLTMAALNPQPIGLPAG